MFSEKALNRLGCNVQEKFIFMFVSLLLRRIFSRQMHPHTALYCTTVTLAVYEKEENPLYAYIYL